MAFELLKVVSKFIGPFMPGVGRKLENALGKDGDVQGVRLFWRTVNMQASDHFYGAIWMLSTEVSFGCVVLVSCLQLELEQSIFIEL